MWIGVLGCMGQLRPPIMQACWCTPWPTWHTSSSGWGSHPDVAQALPFLKPSPLSASLFHKLWPSINPTLKKHPWKLELACSNGPICTEHWLIQLSYSVCSLYEAAPCKDEVDWWQQPATTRRYNAGSQRGSFYHSQHSIRVPFTLYTCARMCTSSSMIASAITIGVHEHYIEDSKAKKACNIHNFLHKASSQASYVQTSWWSSHYLYVFSFQNDLLCKRNFSATIRGFILVCTCPLSPNYTKEFKWQENIAPNLRNIKGGNHWALNHSYSKASTSYLPILPCNRKNARISSK